MRRVQANLKYLTALADQADASDAKVPDRPSIVTSIPAKLSGNEMTEEGLKGLDMLYASLRKLYEPKKAEGSGKEAIAKGLATDKKGHGQGKTQMLQSATTGMPPPSAAG